MAIIILILGIYNRIIFNKAKNNNLNKYITIKLHRRNRNSKFNMKNNNNNKQQKKVKEILVNLPNIYQKNKFKIILNNNWYNKINNRIYFHITVNRSEINWKKAQSMQSINQRIVKKI